jgi:hypothetical protein
MNAHHDLVTATVQKHAADAAILVARLESRERAIPAGRRATHAALALSKQVAEARKVKAAWESLLRVAQPAS